MHIFTFKIANSGTMFRYLLIFDIYSLDIHPQEPFHLFLNARQIYGLLTQRLAEPPAAYVLQWRYYAVRVVVLFL